MKIKNATNATCCNTAMYDRISEKSVCGSRTECYPMLLILTDAFTRAANRMESMGKSLGWWCSL